MVVFGDFTPVFMLKKDDKDISSLLRHDFVSLVVDDYANEQSDCIALTLSDSFNAPSFDDVIECFIGYEETGVWSAGVYSISSSNFCTRNTTIKATATFFNGQIKEKRKKVYKNKKVSEIVQDVADSNQLGYKCDIDDVIDYIEQNESDINFLSRLAADYGAIFKVKRTEVIFMTKSNRKKIYIDLNECEDYNFRKNVREVYQSCEATYHSSSLGRKVKVAVGDGEPVLRLEDGYRSEAAAMRAAKTELARAQRESWSGDFTIAGQDISAGMIVEFYGDRRITGLEFSIKHVQQRIERSFRSICDIEYSATTN